MYVMYVFLTIIVSFEIIPLSNFHTMGVKNFIQLMHLLVFLLLFFFRYFRLKRTNFLLRSQNKRKYTGRYINLHKPIDPSSHPSIYSYVHFSTKITFSFLNTFDK